MDSIKKRGRSKLCMCFRSAAVNPNRKNVSGEPVLIPEIFTPMSDEDLKASLDGGVAGKKGKSHRRLSRVLKAVMFEITLTKNRNGKSRQNSLRSSSNLSTKLEKFSNSMKEKSSNREFSEIDDMLRSNSSRSSSLFSTNASSISLCSSCSSSISSNSRSSSERRGSNPAESKQVLNQSSANKICGIYSSNIGLCVLLLCLFVLIFWGKTIAIFCTSTWLFFAPRRFNAVGSPFNAVDLPDVDSQEYKKRVIMGGLLDRNRSRAL